MGGNISSHMAGQGGIHSPADLLARTICEVRACEIGETIRLFDGPLAGGCGLWSRLSMLISPLETAGEMRLSTQMPHT